MGYFQVHFLTTSNDFFHKIMVAEKKFFQMHNTILQRVKQFLNEKMINLEKCQLPF